MGLLEDLEFLKKQRKPNLLANTRQLQGPAEPYLRQQYPEVYGALGGLLGMAPDEMAGSVLDPNTARVRSGAQIGFPVGTAAQVLPMARPAQAAAMAAGRAGERLAGRVVPQIMERGGMGAEMLQGMSRGTVSPLDVYHGSPHKFDRFDASKIGTGEGAQAYGHGIYTAEAPATAIEYQKKLSSTGSAKNLANQYGGVDKGLAEAKRRVESYKQLIADGGGGAMSRAKSMLQISEKNVQDLEAVKAGLPENTGNLYKVDLPDEQIAKMLDWDKPLSEQSVEIRLSLAPIIEATAKSFPEIRKADPTGAQLYKSYVNHRGNNADYASEGFRQAGIPGIKYLDATSRGAGKGTRNFVTFPGEEKSLTILERNGQPMIARPQQQDATPDLMQYQQMQDEDERKKLGGLLYR